MSGKTRIDHYDNNNIRERGRCVATQTNTRARCTAAVTMYFLLMIMGCDAMCIRVPTTSPEDARAGKGRGRKHCDTTHGETQDAASWLAQRRRQKQ